MSGGRRKGSREKDLTSQYLAGDLDADAVEGQQRFNKRSKFHQQNKTVRTSQMRAEETATSEDLQNLPVGHVVQVYSLFIEVEHAEGIYLCTVRKTLGKVSETRVVVGDRVRFRPSGTKSDDGRPEAAIEAIEPRQTVLARAESFKGLRADPIVANADQMLIVASVWAPFPRWGLIDRMIIAAQSGGLRPIVCLNKIDLGTEADEDSEAAAQHAFAEEALAHYEQMGIGTLQTSVVANVGLEALRIILKDQETVLAGHSGVGKSSLIHAIQPHLEIRIGEVSDLTAKGRHTTTSARRYPLDGGAVIDTPGVKVFGLWGVTPENLVDFFPDVDSDTAPAWRRESYERILDSVS